MSSQEDFHDTTTSFSASLRATIDGIAGETITLRRLIEAIGEQGLLLLCGIASLPFLLPVSIPGVSTVFGAAIVLAALAITLNRLPWLPRRVLDREMPSEKLRAALRRGLDLVGKVERFVRPRLTGLTRAGMVSRFNGLMLMLAGILLMAPLGLVPFSNTLPAIAVLLLAMGMMQRDGVMVLAGYGFIVLTVVYFVVLALLAVRAGQGLGAVLGG
ncbi:exopolysaccharide biosynthesis protein [Frigidibacter sp.]|uniref:exopolysaccharide biosynthesis protein n=1 Tax=Frigidibacter sp. TaxID=2586418 RepID=UPI0027359974|nr:exopolysaccharide biosynthesis protein [Frigidibacter sp.]MDP3340652.1 exopolysaccharide biosynthesis protein [Frigidibacter sp.]